MYIQNAVVSSICIYIVVDLCLPMHSYMSICICSYSSKTFNVSLDQIMHYNLRCDMKCCNKYIDLVWPSQ